MSKEIENEKSMGGFGYLLFLALLIGGIYGMSILFNWLTS